MIAIAKVLGNNTKMTHLNLCEVEANDEAAFSLSRALMSNTKLIELKITSNFHIHCYNQDNRFSKSAIKYFTEALMQNTTLISLQLSSNNVGFVFYI